MTVQIRIAESASLDRWDVKHSLVPAWKRSTEEILAFGDCALRREEANTRGLRYGSIHFDGSVSLRPEETIIKGATYVARPGDVVFSKIDVRNGAIAVIPESIGDVAFTNEFPIYDVKSKGILLPEYVRLVCRTTIFRKQVQALVVGHSGRKRVSPALFEGLHIPVPTISEQRAIVSNNAEAYQQASRLRMDGARTTEDAVEEITKILGLSSPDIAPVSGAFVVPSAKLAQWSVFSAMAIARGISPRLESFFPIRHLGDVRLSTVSYGIQKSPKNRPGNHARPYLRVANVQDGYLDLSEVKTIDVPNDMLAQFRLEVGDILLCEGNSAELVWRPAIWRGEIDSCVHQNHVLRVRLNQDELLPDYVLAYMQTKPSRGHFRRRAKKTTNLATINSADVRELPIPIPPKPVQQEIASLWLQAMHQKLDLSARAIKIEESANQETEQSIAKGT